MHSFFVYVYSSSYILTLWKDSYVLFRARLRRTNGTGFFETAPLGRFLIMKFLLGTKVNMTQFFDESGRAYPATLISAGPVTVTQMKMKEKDGYFAVQVGFGTSKKIGKALKGHFKDRGAFRYVSEFRPKDQNESLSVSLGDVISVAVFNPGDMVMISGISKGKGFQGVVKRHGFHGGPRTHGQKHSEREAGSIGGGGRAGGRVVKGMRMPGRMGGDRITVKNLKVLAVDAERNQVLVSGAVPGRRGTLLELRSVN